MDDYPYETSVKKMGDGVYCYWDTYKIGGDWTINGVRYDDFYWIFFYVSKDGVIYSTRVERATEERGSRKRPLCYRR